MGSGILELVSITEVSHELGILLGGGDVWVGWCICWQTSTMYSCNGGLTCSNFPGSNWDSLKDVSWHRCCSCLHKWEYSLRMFWTCWKYQKGLKSLLQNNALKFYENWCDDQKGENVWYHGVQKKIVLLSSECLYHNRNNLVNTDMFYRIKWEECDCTHPVLWG